MSVLTLPIAIVKREWRQLLLVSSLVLWGFVVGGCAATGTTNSQKTVSAVAKSNNTYVVRRAAVRTPSSHRLQQKRQVARHRVTHKPSQPAATRKPAVKLSKAQYHARYQAQKKAAALAALKHKQAKARAVLAQKKSRQQAIRNQHIAKWKQQQQKRAQYNQNWQKKASAPARKQPARKVAQAHARKPIAKKASRPDPRAKYLKRWERQQAMKRLEAKKAEQRVENVIHNAKKQIGRKYVWGGASPRKGFDCSGLVQHSMNKGANVKVPRTAFEQHRASVKVPAHQAERGDLVFFITRGKKVSHVGIYLGNNKFVHAPRTGQRVKTSTIKGFWKKRLVGFGRIPGACRLPV